MQTPSRSGDDRACWDFDFFGLRKANRHSPFLPDYLVRNFLCCFFAFDFFKSLKKESKAGSLFDQILCRRSVWSGAKSAAAVSSSAPLNIPYLLEFHFYDFFDFFLVNFLSSSIHGMSFLKKGTYSFLRIQTVFIFLSFSLQSCLPSINKTPSYEKLIGGSFACFRVCLTLIPKWRALVNLIFVDLPVTVVFPPPTTSTFLRPFFFGGFVVALFARESQNFIICFHFLPWLFNKFNAICVFSRLNFVLRFLRFPCFPCF